MMGSDDDAVVTLADAKQAVVGSASLQDKLPSWLQGLIFSFLSLKELARVQRVSRPYRLRALEAVAVLPSVVLRSLPELQLAAERCVRLRSVRFVPFGGERDPAPLLVAQLLLRNRASLTALALPPEDVFTFPVESPQFEALLQCTELRELESRWAFDGAEATARLARSLRQLEVVDKCSLDGPALYSAALPRLRRAAWSSVRVPEDTALLLAHARLEKLELEVREATPEGMRQLLAGLGALPALTDLRITAPSFEGPAGAPPIVFERLSSLALQAREASRAALAVHAPNAGEVAHASVSAALAPEELIRRFPRARTFVAHEEGFSGATAKHVPACLAALNDGCWKDLSTLDIKCPTVSSFLLPLLSASPSLQQSLTTLGLTMSGKLTTGQLRRLLQLLPNLTTLRLGFDEPTAAGEQAEVEEEEEEKQEEGVFEHPRLHTLTFNAGAQFESEPARDWSVFSFPGMRVLVAASALTPLSLLPLLRTCPAIEDLALSYTVRSAIFGEGGGPAVAVEEAEAEEAKAAHPGRFLTALRCVELFFCPGLTLDDVRSLCIRPEACKVWEGPGGMMEARGLKPSFPSSE